MDRGTSQHLASPAGRNRPLTWPGALDAEGLRRLLEGLGLEPTRRGLAALAAELAAPRGSGRVPRHAFLAWVAAGGRAPAPATAPGGSIPARRADTLYRVYSIEQVGWLGC